MARSARRDVRRKAAVFVESDETIRRSVSSFIDAFRRLVLQIGGANIASADRALKAAAFLTRSQPAVLRKPACYGGWLRARSSRTAARDPCLIAPLAASADRWYRRGGGRG
jgi:hypothetical protein